MILNVVSIMPLFVLGDGTTTTFSIDLTGIQFTSQNTISPYWIPSGTTFDQVLAVDAEYNNWSGTFGWLSPPAVTGSVSGTTLTFTFGSAPMAFGTGAC